MRNLSRVNQSIILDRVNLQQLIEHHLISYCGIAKTQIDSVWTVINMNVQPFVTFIVAYSKSSK